MFVASLNIHFIIDVTEIDGFLATLGFLNVFLFHLFIKFKCLFIDFVLPVLRVVWILFAIIGTGIDVIFKETVDACSSLAKMLMAVG
jgi:hypothetical protein